MRLEFHPQVSSDISEIVRYYEEVAGPQLADDSMISCAFRKAAGSPTLFAFRERDSRRVNLERFPYHFVFRIVNDAVRILVIRHHGRDPRLLAARR